MSIHQRWVVVNDGKVLIDTNDFKAAFNLIKKKKLPPRSLLTQSYVAGMLLEMLKKTPKQRKPA